jgi:hypothetical protein
VEVGPSLPGILGAQMVACQLNGAIWKAWKALGEIVCQKKYVSTWYEVSMVIDDGCSPKAEVDNRNGAGSAKLLIEFGASMWRASKSLHRASSGRTILCSSNCPQHDEPKTA